MRLPGKAGVDASSCREVLRSGETAFKSSRRVCFLITTPLFGSPLEAAVACRCAERFNYAAVCESADAMPGTISAGHARSCALSESKTCADDQYEKRESFHCFHCLFSVFSVLGLLIEPRHRFCFSVHFPALALRVPLKRTSNRAMLSIVIATTAYKNFPFSAKSSSKIHSVGSA